VKTLYLTSVQLNWIFAPYGGNNQIRSSERDRRRRLSDVRNAMETAEHEKASTALPKSSMSNNALGSNQISQREKDPPRATEEVSRGIAKICRGSRRSVSN
jgi:hypothetical protein